MSVVLLANTSYHSKGSLFILFMVSYVVQKFLSLIRSHLFLFLFPLVYEVGHRGSCCDLWSYSVLPVFSSKSFLVSGLTFRFLIHSEFISVYGVRKCSNFILLQVSVQFSQHHLLKRLPFLHCVLLPPLSTIRCP